MDDATPRSNRDVRYQPDERPPTVLAFGMGAQQAVLCIAGVVLTPVIVIRAAGRVDSRRAGTCTSVRWRVRGGWRASIPAPPLSW